MVGSKIICYGLNKAKLFRLVHRNTLVMTTRSCGWVRDYKPGPLPTTKEEREAAARKYNLLPEDYETHEDGSGYGDYPKLPVVSQDARDPNEEFDYYYHRRNFGETLHADYDMLTSDRTNPNAKYRYPTWVMFAVCFSPFIFFSFVQWLDMHYDLHVSQPMKPKQYYNDGKPHYTFEPAD